MLLIVGHVLFRFDTQLTENFVACRLFAAYQCLTGLNSDGHCPLPSLGLLGPIPGVLCAHSIALSTASMVPEIAQASVTLPAPLTLILRILL
jgi:hypothetical protein